MNAPALGMPPEYALWQELLHNRFWRTGSTGPVVMFTDDDELRKLGAAMGDDPAAALADVINQLAPTPARAFERVCRWQDRWFSGAQEHPPPTLPVLALSVLAAARMRRDRDAPSHNYYLRLAQALRPGAGPGELAALIHRLGNQGDFLPVVHMWQALDAWAGDRSTVRAEGQNRIGYPVSQALLRAGDQAAVTEFFEAVGLRPGGPVPRPEVLLGLFQLWARPSNTSEALRAAASDGKFRELLGGLLCQLAAGWDGTVTAPGGLARVRIRLAVDLDAWVCRWVFATGSATSGDTLIGTVDGAARSVRLELDGSRPAFRVAGELPVTPAAVRDGFTLSGSLLAAQFARPGVLVLSEDPDAGAWVTTDSAVPFEEHVIAAPAALSSRVRQFLERAADRGWESLSQLSNPLLPGWAIFAGVVLSDPGSLQDALGAVPGLRTSNLVPALTAAPRLGNGLPLLAGLGTPLYLTGGEPDLLLPTGAEPRQVPAALDGFPQHPNFAATGFPIPLRALPGGLCEGDHQVEADKHSLRFRTASGTGLPGLPDRTGSLVWDAAGHLVPAASSSSALQAGLPLPLPPAEPVLCRRDAAETWLVFRTGRCQPVAVPDRPRFLQALGQWAPRMFELPPLDTAVAWVVQLRGGRWALQQVRPHGPGFTPLDALSRQLWPRLEACRPAGPAAVLWQRYWASWQSGGARAR